MSVHVYSSSEELSAAAAREFTARAEEAIEERGRFAVVLAGGSTPETMYAILARDYMGRIDWSRVYVFFGDERSVPPHHEDSNHKMASEVLSTTFRSRTFTGCGASCRRMRRRRPTKRSCGNSSRPMMFHGST